MNEIKIKNCRQCRYCYYEKTDSRGYCNMGLGKVPLEGIPDNCPEIKKASQLANQQDHVGTTSDRRFRSDPDPDEIIYG